MGIALPDGQPTVPFDHPDMVDAATRSLQSRYDLGIHDAQAPRPDPDNLMTHTPFTLTDLRQLYETVHGLPIHRDAFARRFDPRLNDSTPLTPAGQMNTRGRPARAFELPTPDFNSNGPGPHQEDHSVSQTFVCETQRGLTESLAAHDGDTAADGVSGRSSHGTATSNERRVHSPGIGCTTSSTGSS